MRRSKADVERYISSVQIVQSASPSPKEKHSKGFLFAKLYFEAKEYELAKRYVSDYLTVQERDPKAHKFLGQLYERDEDINKAVGCYKRSVDLNPTQKDLVLKVAELLCSAPEPSSKAEFWVEKAAKLLPGHPTVFNLREKLLSARGQQGWNQLYDLLQAELQLRPYDAYVNCRLVKLYCSDGRVEDAVKHCLTVEKTSTLRHSLDWYSTVAESLKEYLAQPSVSSNETVCRKFQKELLLAHCSLLRLTLTEKAHQDGVEALQIFDSAMHTLKNTATNTVDELSEVFTEMRAHLYMYAGILLLKMTHEKDKQWRAVVDLASFCYLLAYQVPRPRAKALKGENGSQQPLELLACDRLSQAGHMLLNMDQDLKLVVEAFGNSSGQGALFDKLFGPSAPADSSFIANDDISSIATAAPDVADLVKWDNGAIVLHGGDLQHLTWLGLQWALMAQRPALKDWLKQLFPRLPLETSKLDTNTPESICLLDLEVFLCGVVFTSQTQLQETAKIAGSSQLHEPKCLPLQITKLLSTERQRQWWDAIYSLIHKRAILGMSAKLRMVVQHGLSTLRAGEKHGLQPALAIHWAQHLRATGDTINSYYDLKEYIGRSVHYWNTVHPLLDKIRKKRSIPEPLDPLFMHFHSKDIQISEVQYYEEEAMVASAMLLDIEGKTEQAISILEKLNSISSNWHLAQIYRRLSEEAGNGVEETQGRCLNFLRQFRKYLSKIYNANADDIEKLPVSMEDVMDMLGEVNQQLGEDGETMDDFEVGPVTLSPSQFTEPAAASSHIKFSPSPTKSVSSPSKKHLFSPKTPPHWVEDQKSLLQMLCQQVEALKNEVHDLRHNSSETTASQHHRMYGDSYSAESLQEPFQATQTFHGAPLTVATTGPSVYYNQSPAYNSQYLLRPAANVTPTKAPVYGINRLPPQQHMYAYQQPTHTPPLQTTPACIYPQDQVYGPPLRFESPATNLLSPYSEEYYSHNVAQPAPNPPLPEPGYFTKPSVVTPVQPPKSCDGKPVDFGKINFNQQIPGEPQRVPTFGGVTAQSTPVAAAAAAAAAAFKFNSNFKSNDGDFTFSSTQVKNNSESLLGLLTSDMPPRSEGQSEPKPQSQDLPPSGVFTFGSKGASGFPFTDSAQGKTNIFGNTEQAFSFTDMSKPVFGIGNTVDKEEKGLESDNESTHVDEDEDGPHFEPIVPLPDKVDVKTGEEEEEEMFCNRAKLFRFDTEAKEWKERGIGSIKILKHSTSGKVRLLMRREQVLKICANHYITADMVLRPNAGSDKSWVWYAIDYADETPKTEQLAIRFKTAEEAALFKSKFEEAQKVLPQSPEKQEPSEPPKSSTPEIPVKAIDLKAQFVKKEGEWDCNICCVRNPSSAKQCLACHSPNPDAEPNTKPADVFKGFPAVASSSGGFTFGFAEGSGKDISSASSSKGLASFGSQIPISFKFGTDASVPVGFGSQFEKKPDQWEGSVCEVRNEASANTSRQSPTPSANVANSAPSTATPSSVSSESGFGAQFAKKPGQWDCDTCQVRNEASATSCVACQTPNPSAKNNDDTVTEPRFSFRPGFGTQFQKKEGQWDCDSCLVRNDASATKCVSCQAPCCTETIQMPPQGGFASVFGRKDGQWDCDTCLVRNESSSSQCVSCQTPNPNMKGSAPSSSSFSFSFGSTANQPAPTGFKPSFSTRSTFQFGQSKDKASPATFKFESPTPQADNGKTSNKVGFSFSMPIPAGAFKFGLDSQQADNQAENGSASMFLKNIAEQHREKEKEEEEETTTSVPSEDDIKNQDDNPLFSGKADSFSFADLAKSSQGDFQLGQKDPDFKGFARAGEQLFSSLQPNQKADGSTEQDEDDMYKTEENDDIQFEPVVSMPEKVDLVTGEENEEVLYTQRVKLFRFDPDTSQWKERGVGNLKLLKNNENGRLRVLMRREQVLKVCANHLITTTMNLKPLSGSDRAWMWLANDFSDGDPKPEQLAAKFKTPELAEEFKLKFDECQRLLLDIPLQTPHKLVDTGRTAHLIQKAEEMKSGLKDLKLFLTDDKTKIKEEDGNATTASNASGLIIKPHAESNCPTLEWDNYDLQGEALDDSADASLYASPLASSPVRKNLFRFGESSAGFSFSFQPVLSPAKSPAKLDQSRVSVGTDDEQETTQEEERDGQYFEPVVSLPDLVDISTGEENEQVVFSHRAKLYRYDKDLSQWKERGIGDLKILQNYDTKRVRLVMRRDQVLKLCANHWIDLNMMLEPMKGAEKAWIWSAYDFAEGEGRVEQLAVRFKLQETATAFKEIFDGVKEAQEKGILVTPVSSRQATTSQEMVCGEAAVAVLEATTRERTELSSESYHTPESKTDTAHTPPSTSKTVVSPPKFVFGTDSVQKIFGSPSSSKEMMHTMPTASPKDKSTGAASSSSTLGNDPTTTSTTTPFKVPERGLDFRLFKDNPMAFWTTTSTTQFEPKAPDLVQDEKDADIEIVFERKPTKEQEELAKKLLLPRTFFCYQNEPGYISDDEDDDEDFETAVKNLKGKLYPDIPVKGATASVPDCQPSGDIKDPECVIVWEKKPTPEEEEKAKSLQLPRTFFCGVGSDSDTEKDKIEDFETEVQKVLDAQQSQEALSEQSQEAPSSEQSQEAPSSEQSQEAPSSEQSQEAPSSEQSQEAPSSVQSQEAPSSVQSQEAPSSEQSQEAPSSEQSQEAPSSEQSQEAPSSVQSQEAPSSVQSQEAPSSVQSQEAPSSVQSQEAPSSVQSQEAPSSVLSQEAPSSEQSQEAPSSVQSQEAPSSEQSQEASSTEQSQETPSSKLSQEAPSSEVSDTSSAIPVASVQPSSESQVDSGGCPIDLSSKKISDTDSSSSQNLPAFGFVGDGFSFAELAKTSGEFAFGRKDSNFSWANAGAAVFGTPAELKRDAEEDGSDDDDALNNADIHFEPIVSLPEVEVKSGEEDEEILFKERTKLYRWDRDLSQWKERGIGDIKILYHPVKKYYRVLMRREQVLKVCANHTITMNIDLKPMNTSNNAFVWTATDYAEGDAKVEQLAAKFKTPELAESFRKTFVDCQRSLSQVDSSQLSRAMELSKESNPVVFFMIAADDEPIGKITIELFAHIVPKTAENFRVLCTGEKGFGYHNSIFHRVIPDFMCQGGDITNQDGTGGKSIYGGKFEDENYDVRHTGPGLLSMANRGRDTNNSQFFITLKKAEHLDFKHVAFGFVRDGMDVVKRMGEFGAKSGKPSKKITITECGQL